MEVPLSVEPVVVKGKEQLEIWSNGKQQFINPNSKPYFYTKEKLSIHATKVEKVKAIQLSNYKEKIFYKYYFETREALTKARIKGKTFEDNIPFILRNRLDNPDIYTKYKHKADLKFLFLDIEQFCKPEEPFPTYEDRIISIAWCTNDRKVKCAYIKKESQTDKELLELFVKQYQKINPDVLVVFNKSYDIPTILKRCIRNKIDTSHFSKNNDKPRLIGKNKITIPGVIIYDVWDSVRVDQALTGNVESRKLKPVSDYYGFQSKNKVLPGNEISNYIGTKELVGYNKEDVYRLLHLFDIYWPGIEYNANDLKLPLNFVTDMNTTNLGIIVMGDEYQTRNIIADGKNSDRYPEIFQVKREGGNYEGALVGISKTGLFEPVYKVDVGSMYPSIMSTFNLSPDTTTLLQYEPYGKFKIEEEDNWFIYHIPDKILDRNMVIQVLKKPGFIAQLVQKFLDERSQYKKLWKKTDNPIYRAMSDNRKLKANGGVYGVQGAPSHPYGFAPSAVATTGIGRECGQLLIDILEELYPGSVLEYDSVTGDTPIFIKDKKTKEIDIIPIEDLSDGSLRQYIEKYETLTRSGWKDINYVYCHEVEKNICTINTFGARIDVTEDHSIFSNKKEVYPKNLDKGHIIDIYPPEDYNGNCKELNENQAWLLGFFLSDGSIHKRKPKKTVFYNMDGSKRKLRKHSKCYDFTIAKKNKELLKKALYILEKEFNFPCKIYDTLKSSACYKLEGWKKEPIEYIRSICYCKDLKTKKVPKQILNAPINVVEAFFQGLTDGDGHIATDKKNEGKWSITSMFKPLAAGIAYLLDRRKITYNVLCRKDKPHITSITTHKPKEFCVRNVRKNHPGTITKILTQKRKTNVYDLSTDDGTFVAGVGRVICHNTDGVYFHTKYIDKQKILDMFANGLKEKFEKNLDIFIDFDDYDKGYFYKTKNYVLQRGDKLIFHGVAMKASSKTPMAKSLIREIAKAKLSNQPTDEIIKKYQKLDFPVRDFAMNVTMGMHFSQYKQPQSTLVCQLALAAQRTLGIEPELGNQYYYIKTLNGYKLLEIAQKDEIDKDYYLNEIDKVVKMFGCEIIHGSLQKWGI